MASVRVGRLCVPLQVQRAVLLVIFSCGNLIDGTIFQQPEERCYHASRERLQSVALNNTLLLAAVDLPLWEFFGPSWVLSAQTAAISYWLIATMDNDTAMAVEAAGYGHRCVLVPKPKRTPPKPVPRAVRKRRARGGDYDTGHVGNGSLPDRSGYMWNSITWRGATWGKVAAVAKLVDLGFNVVHSDIDVTWFQDPLKLFLNLAEPAVAMVRTEAAGTREGWLAAAAATSSPSALFATDLLTTLNTPTGGQDSGLERSCDPSYSLNTGVYWVSGAEAGANLMRGWLALRDASDLNDDQQALNVLVRGTAMELRAASLPAVYDLRAALAAHEQQQVDGGIRRTRHAPKRLGVPWPLGGTLRHMYLAAGAPGVAGAEADGVVISCLPVSSFSHTYAFATSRLHELRQHPLYEVHWVWGGKSLESKRQCMRDAMVFTDPPEYYNPHRVMTFDLEHQEMPPGYNTWPSSRTSEMVDFSLPALSAQLQQAYWALALAMAINRTLVLPKFRCYCAKNWFATSACRINSERDTVFPFPCPLSHVFRAKLLLSGELKVADPRPHPHLGSSPSIQGGPTWRVADVREPSFLSNPRTDESLRFATPSLLRVRNNLGDADDVMSGGSTSSSRTGWSSIDNSLSHSGSDGVSGSGDDVREIVLDRPRTDRELQELLLAPEYDTVRVLHVPRPAAVISGFADALMWQQYDTAVQRVTATWCCHSTREASLHGGSRRERLQPLPPSRQ